MGDAPALGDNGLTAEPGSQSRLAVAGVLAAPAIVIAAMFMAGTAVATAPESCPLRPTPADATTPGSEIHVSVGLDKLELDYGDDRGVRTASMLVSATATDGGELPDALEVDVLPLRRGSDREVRAVDGTATRFARNRYAVELCVEADSQVAAGTYSSALYFTGDEVRADPIPITVRLQAPQTGMLLWVGLPIAAMLGVAYTAFAIEAAREHDRFLSRLQTRLTTPKTLIAVILGIGAAFAVWQGNVHSDPAFGRDSTQVLSALVLMAGASATSAAATYAAAGPVARVVHLDGRRDESSHEPATATEDENR